jgi:hypothetical protein
MKWMGGWVGVEWVGGRGEWVGGIVFGEEAVVFISGVCV